LIVKKNRGPVCMREWGTWGWGGFWCEYYSAVRYTTVNRSRRICCRKGKDLVATKNDVNDVTLLSVTSANTVFFSFPPSDFAHFLFPAWKGDTLELSSLEVLNKEDGRHTEWWR
jgi:hypothetical protein